MLDVTILPMTAALLLDQLLGDPSWFPHPVVGFGRLIRAFERHVRRQEDTTRDELTKGLFLVLVLLLAAALPPVLLMHFTSGIWKFLLMTFFFWTALALKSMTEEAMAVKAALEEGSLEDARAQVGRIVGRDTSALDRPGITRACIESVAESTSDGIIAPMFWGLLLGPGGAMAYKAVNTLDSMVGYDNDRYRYFGRASARLDDLLNLLPARITGLLTVLLASYAGGRTGEAFRIYVKDRKSHASPNSGHPEAAFAGALGIELAGPASYFGQVKDKPRLNLGARTPEPSDIGRALRLMKMLTMVFLLLAFLIVFFSGVNVWTGIR